MEMEKDLAHPSANRDLIFAVFEKTKVLR
jgi:hypothetical protein